MPRQKTPNLDWETGCFEPALARIERTLAEVELVTMPLDQIAARILSDLADINIGVEFLEGPTSTDSEVFDLNAIDPRDHAPFPITFGGQDRTGAEDGG